MGTVALNDMTWEREWHGSWKHQQHNGGDAHVSSPLGQALTRIWELEQENRALRESWEYARRQMQGEAIARHWSDRVTLMERLAGGTND